MDMASGTVYSIQYSLYSLYSQSTDGLSDAGRDGVLLHKLPLHGVGRCGEGLWGGAVGRGCTRSDKYSVVCYFLTAAFSLLSRCAIQVVSKWDEMGVLKKALEHKLLFIETKVGVL
jgi:hypothetical protein